MIYILTKKQIFPNSIVSPRKNVLVIGDHPKDALIGERLPKDCRQVRLGFANALGATKESVQDEFKNYDALLLGDGSFAWINEIVMGVGEKNDK
jgi:Pyrimidine 5'-nucleotidase (UMPH-1)